jgi:hypothetical protein
MNKIRTDLREQPNRHFFEILLSSDRKHGQQHGNANPSC